MAENLKYLPSVVGPTTGSNTEQYYYIYGYNGTNVTDAKATSNYTTYGVLYNWTAAMSSSASSITNPSGVNGVCPTGWHLPSSAEWTELTSYLGGRYVAGARLKEVGTTHWRTSFYSGATNESGFTALPGGYSNGSGQFFSIGSSGYWWSASAYNTTSALTSLMEYNGNGVTSYIVNKNNGVSVRCVKD